MSNAHTKMHFQTHTNGAAPAAETQENISLATKRAEETLDRAGEQAGKWLAEANRWLRRSFALAREEAEDIWAEAQSLHRKNMP